MSKPILYIRDGFRKRTDAIHSGFTRHASNSVITTYQQAVLIGQRDAGYGNFFVETGDSSPSREDQLLLEPRRSRKRNPHLTEAMNLD